MKLSLYSQIARKHIIKARKYIKELKLEPNEETIRAFRREVISGKYPELIHIADSGSNFFTTSECRDLIFHHKEHRFTISEIEKALNANNLNFLGFLLNPQFKYLYKKLFPVDKKQTDLKNWASFEEKYPEAFLNTPPFWVSKNYLS